MVAAYSHEWQLPTHREHQQQLSSAFQSQSSEREYYCVHTHLIGSLSEAIANLILCNAKNHTMHNYYAT